MLPDTVSGIYAIQRNGTDQIYIGSAVNCKKRWADHRWKLRKDRHENQILQNSWNKYGESSFSFAILELTEDRSCLVPREQAWIDELVPHFNICKKAGSCLGTVNGPKSAAAKEKIAAAARLRWANPAFREAQREKQRCPRHTPESRAKISAARKGKAPWNKGIKKRKPGSSQLATARR